MKKNKIQAVFVLLAAVVFAATGCARNYIMHVDSISDMSALAGKTYIIAPGNKDTTVNELQFKEFAGLLVKAMTIQGYVAAGPNQDADMEIYLSYGIGEPEKRLYTYSEPIWGQTGVNIYNQTNQLTGKDNNTTSFSTTYVDPQYGVTGFTDKTEEYTVYKKYAVVDVFEIRNVKPGAQMKELWKTSIATEGKSHDLRKVFPGMMAAAAKYLGLNTGEELTVEVTRDSPLLKTIKGN